LEFQPRINANGRESKVAGDVFFILGEDLPEGHPFPSPDRVENPLFLRFFAPFCGGKSSGISDAFALR